MFILVFKCPWKKKKKKPIIVGSMVDSVKTPNKWTRYTGSSHGKTIQDKSFCFHLSTRAFLSTYSGTYSSAIEKITCTRDVAKF